MSDLVSRGQNPMLELWETEMQMAGGSLLKLRGLGRRGLAVRRSQWFRITAHWRTCDVELRAAVL